jgi:hypothetical protein
MVISGVAGVFSPILFREGGLIWGTTTRKGIVITAICFTITIFLSGVAMVIHSPSNFLTAIACVGGGTVTNGIYFLVIYLRLPRAREKYLRVMSEREKILKLIREEREKQRKEKDGKGE